MKRLAYNIRTNQLVYFDYITDNDLYRIRKHGPDFYVGPKHRYILGIVEINKFLKP